MCEGYKAGRNDHSGIEDEFLCEFVDGTMDPLVREVFEEYLAMNPDLRAHVHRLQRTRMLLCRFSCRCRAPRDLHERLRREISCEMMRVHEPFQLTLSDHLRSFANVTSALSILLLVGMIAGVSVFDIDPTSGMPATGAVVFGVNKAPSRVLERPASATRGNAFSTGHSGFSPLFTVRSSVPADAYAGWHRSDTSVAVLRSTRLAP